MPINSKKDFYDFLRVSKKFCRQVDNYITTLGLNTEVVETYKNNNRFLAAITSPEKMDDAWDEKMMHNKVENLHIAFSHLVQLIKNSTGYSPQIGMELGIETNPQAMVAAMINSN